MPAAGEVARFGVLELEHRGADRLQKPAVVLDEPTNHLDISSLEWLEHTLLGLDAAVVVVAHDRWFLEAVGTSVLELEDTKARYFAGSWHQWRKERAARELALGRAVAAQQAEIARMERFIERFRYKATKARQAQSRVKKLAKLERIERDPGPAKSLEFAFSAPTRSARVVFELRDARIEVGGEPATRGHGNDRAPRVLLEHAELWLERGEHVSLVGANGTGKTTLIESLAGRVALAAGHLSTGHNVKIGYLSQHGEELSVGGPAGERVLEAVGRATGLTPGKASALLGRFLFSGEEAQKPLESLSGGERRRLSLAILVRSGANVLILDEPTNHLDIESREALEDALRAFTGAVLLVSHDRALLDAVGTRTIAVEEASLHSYAGGWPEYARAREAREAGAASAPAPAGARTPVGADSANGSRPARARASTGAKAKPKPKAKASPKDPSKNRLREQRKAEQAIEAAEAALSRLEDELADPAAWATRYESAKSQARHTAARRAVEEAYTQLEQLVD
jgi:ATP-binding cassette subfamily F protein 3